MYYCVLAMTINSTYWIQESSAMMIIYTFTCFLMARNSLPVAIKNCEQFGLSSDEESWDYCTQQFGGGKAHIYAVK